jgi:hypothetical protein
MSHQPYETWLVTDEPLDSQQQASLTEHLRDCRHCQQLKTGWGQVEGILKTRTFRHPTAGFTERWQARLRSLRVRDQKRMEYRSGVIFIGVTISLAILIATLMVVQVFTSYETATQFAVRGTTYLISVIILFATLRQLVETIMILASSVIPPIGWLVLAFASGFVCIGWVESLRRIMSSRRIIQ